MKVYINDNNEIKAVGTSSDTSLKEVEINDETNPFKNWSDEKICCYKVRVYKGEVTMMTPYIDTRIIEPFELLARKMETKVSEATSEVSAMAEVNEDTGLSVNDKMKLLLSAMVIDETPEEDGIKLPHKEGYIWERKVQFVDGVPHISWVLIEDPDYVPTNDGSDYLKAIEWHEGDEVTEGLWYNVGDDLIWLAIKSGIPSSAEDTEYFDIVA